MGLCKKVLPPTAAEFSLDGDIFFLISQSEIRKKMSPSKFYLARSAIKRTFYTSPDRGCVKRFLPPAAAEYYFETDVFFMILRSKIMKNTSVSNLNLLGSGLTNIHSNPLTNR